MKSAPANITFEIRMFFTTIGHVNYPRPGIVTRVIPNQFAEIYMLSTKNYSEPGQSFCIRAEHPDFRATGLEATSYTIHPPKDIPLPFVNKVRGELTGNLAKEFQTWLE